MSRAYSSPSLLIEFSADRAFCLQSGSDIRDSMEITNICSKLALLTIAFPRLRILWARDPRATVDLFCALKQGQPDVDTATALAVGTEAEQGDGDGSGAPGATAAGGGAGQAR